jgi:hypothetical protein
MTTTKKDDAGLSRREFLTLSGLGVAGATLGFPDIGRAQEKKPKYGGILRVGERF